jgi:hypothetical protein
MNRRQRLRQDMHALALMIDIDKAAGLPVDHLRHQLEDLFQCLTSPTSRSKAASSSLLPSNLV